MKFKKVFDGDGQIIAYYKEPLFFIQFIQHIFYTKI